MHALYVLYLQILYSKFCTTRKFMLPCQTFGRILGRYIENFKADFTQIRICI